MNASLYSGIPLSFVDQDSDRFPSIGVSVGKNEWKRMSFVGKSTS